MKILKHIIALFVIISFVACGAYSFTGASISDKTKTFQVNHFENNSILIEPGLNVDFRNALLELLENQTNLSNVNSNGDIVYEGEISEYRISPTTSTSQNTAAQNRLTIGVKIRFFDKHDEEGEFENTFSFFYDYPASEQLLGGTKDRAYQEIFERITQDIFNASLAKW